MEKFALIAGLGYLILQEIGVVGGIKSLVKFCRKKYHHRYTCSIIIQPIEQTYHYVLYWVRNKMKDCQHVRNIPNLTDDRTICDLISTQDFETSFTYQGKEVKVKVILKESEDIFKPFKIRFNTDDNQIIPHFLKECYNLYSQQVGVSIYTWNEGWNLMTHKKPKTIDKLFLPSDFKKKLLISILQFKKRQELKKSYLLHGVGGTGKSSTIFAIASQFHFDVYLLNLADPNLNDNEVLRAVQLITPNSILALEDIDLTLDKIKSDEYPLTLSGIYNLLDGFSLPSHLIIMMTTNCKEKLPSNMIRAGRVDLEFFYDYANKDQIWNLINYYYDINDISEVMAILNKKVTIADLVNIVNQSYDYNYFIKNLQSSFSDI